MARGPLEAIRPELRWLSEAPELEKAHKSWSESRVTFNADLRRPESEAVRNEWQRLYFRGLDPSGAQANADGHRVKLRMQPFKRRKALESEIAS
jgi:Family of unknown function (DUF6065)